MKRTARFFSLLALALALISGCDFPDDPPLRRGEPKVVVEIDSARSLLPLRTGNIWQYIAVPESGRPQSPSAVTALQQTFSGLVYWELPYLYFHPKGTHPGNPIVAAFPALIRPEGKGLTFYERNLILDSNGTRYPKMMFTLPYPARVDSVCTFPRSEYTVRVVSKSCVVQHYDSTSAYTCYQYEVEYEGKERTQIYVIPGTAIFKVSMRDLTFYTVEWKVE
ncbi:MAG: hypothetical protein HY962_03185 [Ignavibacteriae bacterium]|nr:hypothetical protein [Ignavibacteriota bacterium]